MLLFQKDLGLGKVLSNLYALLLDLVLETDAENPDATEFLRKKSLTLYFDDAHLKGDGFKELVTMLEVQAVRSMEAVVQFVSELRGVKHLIDSVRTDAEAQIVIVNSSAKQFTDWLKTENLSTQADARGRLRTGLLQSTDARADEVIPPGLIYMAGSAFDDGHDENTWLRSLSSLKLAATATGASAAIVLSPILLSASAGDDWRNSGKEWIASAQGAPAPVIVVGPSFRLNPVGDGFPTTLPSGYAFCAHFLSRPTQKLRNQTIYRSEGRLRVAGFGADLVKSLDQLVWGEGGDDRYCFAADFYLYIILTLAATAKYSGVSMSAADLRNLFRCFYWSDNVDNPPDLDDNRSSRAIDAALPGGNAFRFALDQDLARPDTSLRSVTVFEPTNDPAKRKRLLTATDMEWFNAALTSARLL